ncbi:MAG: nicotinamide riboside transporter PnuC [Blastocatellia bacterium]
MKLTAVEIICVIAPGVALTVASWRGWLPLDLTETLGFVTGAICVYLVVRENIWNFPLGLVNNIFFLLLFTRARLYGDAGLQLIYLALGIHGWRNWLRGGQNQTRLPVSRASWRFLALLVCLIIAGTASLLTILRIAGGAAPLPDALTTILSLAAQYMLNRKLIENWYCWIIADVMYIWLYLTRGLGLTAVLYAIFLCLCLAGLWQWRRSLSPQPRATENIV